MRPLVMTYSAQTERDRYHFSREDGLCVECRAPATSGRSRCEPHRQRQNQRARRLAASRGISSRRVCRHCGQLGHDRRTCQHEGVSA